MIHFGRRKIVGMNLLGMRWVDTVVVVDSIAALVVGGLLFLTLRKRGKSAPEWALFALFFFQLAWIVSDGLAVVLAIHFDFISEIHGGFTGLAIVGMVLSAYLFCEFYPRWNPGRGFALRLSGVLLITLPFCVVAFTPYWVANRRVVDGVKVGDPGPAFILMGLWAMIVVFIGVLILFLKFRRLPDLRVRKNIRIFALGILLNLLLSLLTSYVLPLYGIPEFDFVGPVASLLFISIMLYAISFHRLVDIESAALTTLFHTLVVAAAASVLFAVFHFTVRENLPWYVWMLFALLFFGGLLYDRFVRPRLDTWFLRKKTRRPEGVLVHLLSGRAFDLRDMTLDQLLHEVLGTLCESLDVERGLILTTDRFRRPVFSARGDLRTLRVKLPLSDLNRFQRFKLPEGFLKEFDGVFLLEGSAGGDFQKEADSDGAHTLSFDSPARLAVKFPRISRTFYSLLQLLKSQSLPIFIPLILHREICGYILLGEKSDRNPYYREDLKMLAGVRTSIALAIRNFLYYEELDIMRDRAEAEVEKLTEALSHRQTVSVNGRTLLYSSPLMEDVIRKSSNAARASSQPVLILGETGTGKELIARNIHEESLEHPSRKRPFVAINCAAIPASLWEDDVFGHVKGAFTDARSDRVGKIEEAADGTVFFDEIGEMPLEMQAKMLRLLQERVFTPIGANRTREAKCRFIFATNRNLEEMVAEGLFRQDLYYRINVLQVEIPPLRSRKEDVPLLVQHFLGTFAADLNAEHITAIAPEALNALANYSYPGNIRELENIMIRAIAGTEGDTLQLKDLPPQLLDHPEAPEGMRPGSTQNAQRNGAQRGSLRAGAPELDLRLEGNFRELVNEYRRTLIEHALQQAGGNKTAAAQILGIKRTTLNSQIAELEIG
ncbi:MAG: sigma 54-interacting transcriptional regulator [bacterium]|nr:sigma 54-interacting transcriptional regulator [bacterium]